MKKTFNIFDITLFNKEIKLVLVEELKDTEIRLHAYLINLKNKISQKKKMNKKRKQEKLFEYRYYLGKFLAYLYVLESLGEIQFVNSLMTIRGMKMIEEAKIYDKTFGEFVKELEKK